MADEGAPADAPPLLADAVDDLADITQDMREVLWRAEHLGQDDAQWAFRLYFFHWSRHARHLATYLRGRSLP